MHVTIASAQYPISQFHSWEDYAVHVENWVASAAEKGAEILVFPEYGSMEITSLYPYQVQQDLHAQIVEMGNHLPEFIHLYEQLAKRYSCVIIAPSYPVMYAGKNVNRVHVFGKNGLAGHQDKLFMTRFENEEWRISSVDQQLKVFSGEFGKFIIQVCYDIEFPLGGRTASAHALDFILVPSCTESMRGAERVHIGARSRAMENQCYSIVSQTILNASWSPAVDVNYGFAAFYATPDVGFQEKGIQKQGTVQLPGWEIHTLDTGLLQHVRESGQVFNLKDNLRLNITLDGKVPELVEVQY